MLGKIEGMIEKMVVMGIATAAIIFVLTMVKTLAYSAAFYFLSADEKRSRINAHEAAISSIRDPLVKAQMTVVEKKLQACQSAQDPGSSLPVMDFWFQKEQLLQMLDQSEARCLKDVLDRVVVVQPQAAAALAAEAAAIGYTMPIEYRDVDARDPKVLAGLQL